MDCLRVVVVVLFFLFSCDQSLRHIIFSPTNYEIDSLQQRWQLHGAKLMTFPFVVILKSQLETRNWKIDQRSLELERRASNELTNLTAEHLGLLKIEVMHR